MRNWLRSLLTPELAISVIIYLLFLNYVIQYFSKAGVITTQAKPKSAPQQIWDSMVSLLTLSSIAHIFVTVSTVSASIFILTNKRHWIKPAHIRQKVGNLSLWQSWHVLKRGVLPNLMLLKNCPRKANNFWTFGEKKIMLGGISVAHYLDYFLLVGAFIRKRLFVIIGNNYSALFVSVFFDTPEVTKKVLPKVLQNFKKTPNCTCWPKELNQKGFPRNIQYRTRPKVPLSVFSALRLFSKLFFGCCRGEYFDTLKSFCYFFDLDMAPTCAGTGLLHLLTQLHFKGEQCLDWLTMNNHFTDWKDYAAWLKSILPGCVRNG